MQGEGLGVAQTEIATYQSRCSGLVICIGDLLRGVSDQFQIIDEEATLLCAAFDAECHDGAEAVDEISLCEFV